MFSIMEFGKSEDHEENTKPEKVPSPPPDDLEYWIPKLNWDQDSYEVEKQGQFGPIHVDEVNGTVEDIKADLKKHAGEDLK